MRCATLSVALTWLALAPAPPPESATFSVDPYLADLEQLATLTATTYANFEWALRDGGVDPVEVHRRARQALVASRSDEEARTALKEFVEAFGDGHFRLTEPQGSATVEPKGAPGPETPAAEACALLGYEEHDQSLRLDPGPGFHWVTGADDPFPAGWLEREDGRRIGLLRIDEFGPNKYGEYCPQSWLAYRGGLQEPCDEWECKRRFELELTERLLSEIEARVELLEATGIQALVVDITANGGGSEWNDPVARLFTERELRGSERSAVRHPHWRGILEGMAAEVAADLERDDLPAELRTTLEAVASRLELGIAQAATPCDLTQVWEGELTELPCSILVRGALFSTGLVAEPPGEDAGGLLIGQALFTTLDYDRRPAAWSGPLAVLIDRGTASAAEMFAALLRDNDAAILIGQPTFGVGCGYTNGGIRTRLEHSGLEVRLPDCVRHRRDGGNERAGLSPDIAVAWERGESPAEKGARLRAMLESWELEPRVEG